MSSMSSMASINETYIIILWCVINNDNQGNPIIS